jgi:flavodoxin
MKSIIIYTSKGGATEIVAKLMAKELNAYLTTAEQTNPEEVLKYDLVGFGSGIYAGKHDNKQRELLDSLSGKGKKAFVFSTSGKGTDDYNNKFKEAVKEKGFELQGSFACKGYCKWFILKLFGVVNKGHPNEMELKESRDFAKSLKA